MIKNYFKIAWRNLLKNKKSSFINISGLAIGMAVAILIGLWIWDELTYDKYNKNYDTVAQVYQRQTWNGEVYTQQALPFPMGEELRTNYGSDFKYIAMASWEGDHILTVGDKHINKNGFYIDKEGPAILDLNMIHGSLNGFVNPNSVMLSESTANIFFGNANPMNQVMKLDSKMDVKVVGVYKDLPYNSKFNNLQFIAPWELYKIAEPWLERAATQWGNNSFQCFAQINNNTDFAAVDKKIINSKINKQPEEDKKFKAEIFLNPMNDWHLRSSFKEGVRTGGGIVYVWMFALIGAFVLLLACINFMNLSTARSEKRSKEVGIRKTVGSLRSQLIWQFLSESVLVAFIAFAFALIFTQLMLPWFNQVADKKMSILWGNIWFWAAGFGFTIFTGLVAGSYPALYLSSFKPIKVLKGTFKVGRLASVPRKVLVVTQFTVSVALIIGTVIVYQQIQYTKNRPVGYNRDGLVMIMKQSEDFNGKLDVLRSELKKENVIEEIAESSNPITAVWSNSGGFDWEGKDPNLDTDFATFWVSHDYGKTVGFEIKEGRDFSRDFGSDTASILINEASIKFMNIKDPIGKIVRWGRGDNPSVFTIVGVVKDMVMSSPYSPVKQAVYLLDRENANWINLKLNPNKSTSESMAVVERVFRKIIPSAPFDYKFADAEYAVKFSQEVRIGKLAGMFTILAVIISCLGLFGLASFVAEQRTKEIGIRKIVGASVINLWGILSKDFVVLVLISCLIAAPIAYYYLHSWLQQYTYRVSISWWVFAAAVVGAIVITLLTVSFQAIKAATINPVKSLRSE